MSTLTQETRHVQNPALGAVLLWRYTSAWTQHSATSAHPPLQLLFIVLPILLHHETFAILQGTNRPSGLHGFADKFSRASVGKTDMLAGIHSRVLSWRTLTWRGVQFAIRSRLITLSTSTGTVIPLTASPPTGLPVSIRPLLRNAEKLGQWCSPLPLFEVATILKVRF